MMTTPLGERMVLQLKSRIKRRARLSRTYDISPLTADERQEVLVLQGLVERAGSLTVLTDAQLDRAEALISKCERVR